jgi:type I restriction enzyme M protein
MQSDGYSLDDKRTKLDGYGDLQDIVERYKSRNPQTNVDRNGKCFFISKKDIEANGYDLSYSKYKEEIYEELIYEKPEAILSRLIMIEDKIFDGLNDLEKFIQ